MKILSFFLILANFGTANANLELISSYTSPGCESKIVYSRCESYFLDEENPIYPDFVLQKIKEAEEQNLAKEASD